MTKPHPVSMIALGTCVSAIAAVWMQMIIGEEISGGRREYQTIIPFVIGLVIATPASFWPIKKFFKGWKRLIARSVLFTMLLAPVPFGPEGTMLPLIITLIFPPLIFLFLYPGRIALAFCFFVGFFSVLDGIKMLIFPARPTEKATVSGNS